MHFKSHRLSRFLARFDAVVDGWVHDSVTADQSERRLHRDDFRGFAAATLFFLFGLPLVLAVWFPQPVAFAAGIGSAALPIMASAILALSGNRVMTAWFYRLSLVGAITILCLASGGLSSALLPWLALVPLDAYLRSRRMGDVLCSAGLVALVTVMMSFIPDPAFASADNGLAMVVSLFAMLVYGALVMPLSGTSARGLPGASSPEKERDRAAAEDPSHGDPGPQDDIWASMPGLVIFHEAGGRVIGHDGADAAELAARIGLEDGQNLLNHVHVEDRIAYLQAFDQIRTGSRHVRFNVRLKRGSEGRARDGLQLAQALKQRQAAPQFLVVEIDLVPIRSAAGTLGCIAAITRDISETVRLRHAESLLIEELRQAEAARTSFLATVSHELRTPLNAIIGFSDMLARGMAGPIGDKRQSEYVGLIGAAGQHLLSLVNTILDMTRMEAGRYDLIVEPFEPKEVIESCEAMMTLQAREKQVQLISRSDGCCPDILADRRAFQQIIINLMANAVKFTGHGGVVTVDYGCDDGDFVLTVADTGIGIPDDMLEMIGQPFVKVQQDHASDQEGSGLGLSVVKGLVALHDGRFQITSKVGQGTVVMIRLPMAGPAVDKSVTGTVHEPDAVSAAAYPPCLASDLPAGNTSINEADHDKKALSA